jgi:hypothetical protein
MRYVLRDGAGAPPRDEERDCFAFVPFTKFRSF